jgi:hypothetical protein
MNRPHLSHFNRWLDAVVGGRSTPPPAASDPALLEATSAARQLHDLVQTADAAPPHRSLPSTWEEFMHAHHLDASLPASSTRQPASRSSRINGSGYPAAFDALTGRPARLAGNVLLAAIVLAVLVAGAWRAADSFRPTPPDAPSTIPFGAFAQDDATPTAGEIDLLTPATADQCTITPLTVDEVVAIVQDPWAGMEEKSLGSTPVVNPPLTDGDLWMATPDIDPNAVRPAELATDDALAGATATFHMFEACIEAQSYFQAWATWDPALLQQEILRALPPLTGDEELRALLTDLAANGLADPSDADFVFWPLGSGPAIAPADAPQDAVRIQRTVDQNLDNTWMPEPGSLVTGYTNHFPDLATDNEFDVVPPQSIYDSNLDGTPEPLVGYDPRLKQPSCFTIIFSWSESRDMWLIQQYPVCG